MLVPVDDDDVTRRALRAAVVIKSSPCRQRGVTRGVEHRAMASHPSSSFARATPECFGGEHPLGARSTHGRDSARLEAVWARNADEVAQAQRLRYRVFVEEMGARLSPPRGTPARLDVDRFDPFCEHLLVRSIGRSGRPERVVGTYRVLLPDAARRIGSLYSDAEFDLCNLDPLRPTLAELGRSCIDPKWRSGAVILRLWSSLATFMASNGLRQVVGCASVPMRDGGHVAASLWRHLRDSHLAPAELRVRPWIALPVDELRDDLVVEAPPLIRGYLRCGAKILGAPAWDPDFGTADLPMLLDLADLPDAYRRRFAPAAVGAAT